VTEDLVLDELEYYEELFDPLRTDRKARRSRKPIVKRAAPEDSGQVIAEVAEVVGLEGGFVTTYHPARYETGWLLSSLRSFYDRELVTDVLALVKGGKEASVYRCTAHPRTGMGLLAAKVYRPRKFRNLRNDKMYREGREILKADGRAVNKSDHRIMRAIGKKTAFGVQVQHTSWLMHEYTALERLYRAGAAVPQPVAVGENAILISYHGDARRTAPTLNEVSLELQQAKPLFREVLRNVELMLQHGLVHGDLSAYNILYWAGEITLIDFPQVTSSYTNGSAHDILHRDIVRVCEYFARQGIRSDPEAILADLWHRYVRIDPTARAADASRDLVEE